MRPRREADARASGQRRGSRSAKSRTMFHKVEADTLDKDAVNEWYVLLSELGLVLDALLDNEKALSIKMSSDGMSVQIIVREDLPFGQESEAYAAYDTESAMALAVLLAGLPDDWVASPPQDDGGRDGGPAF